MTLYHRVPTPWRLRLQRLRHSALPIICFGVCLATAVWLWQRQMPQAVLVGEADVVRLDVGAPSDGRLIAFRSPWTLYDAVQPHQVIARFDDTAARFELEAAKLEVERLHKELEAVRAQTLLAESDRRSNRLGDLLRAVWESESRRLDVLDRTLAMEIAKVELQRREARLEYLQSLLDSGAANQMQYSDELLLHDKLQRQVAEAATALSEAQTQHESARKQLADFPPLEEAPIQTLLAPLQAAAAAQEARVKQLEYQIAALEVRAPMAGVIAAIHRWPGQTVRQGEPIVTIATGESRYIVSYIRQEQQLHPEVGAGVEIRPRRIGSAPWRAVIDKVGPQVELIPEHQRRDPKLLEWGRPIRILLPRELPAVPGELFDVRFQPAERGDRNG